MAGPNKPTDELITSFARANRIIDAQMLHRELHGSSVMQAVRAIDAIAKAS